MGEFELIQLNFQALSAGADVALGIGDDAALLTPTPGQQLVACTDTLVEGRHFLPGADAADLGWKALAVNLSDLAAMGAQPRWCLLALTLPEADEDWLQAFAHGLHACCERYGVALVGGDTTRGPLTLTVTALGEVSAGQALRRDGAQVGDVVALTGPVGDGAAGLAVLQDAPAVSQLAHARAQALVQRYLRPAPRLAAGDVCAGLATAAIDVSDGLLQDLGHVLQASGVGARIDVAAIPASEALLAVSDADLRRQWQFAGGDDYELVVSLAPSTLATAQEKLAQIGHPPLHVIGKIVSESGLVDAKGGTTLHAPGFSHF